MEESITLQIGPSSNMTGTNLWNTRSYEQQSYFDNSGANDRFYFHQSNSHNVNKPRCIMVDFHNAFEIPVVDGKKSISSQDALWSGTCQIAYKESAQNKKASSWLELMRPELNDKSLISLPSWVSDNNFSDFSNGKLKSSENIDSTFMENNLMERIRYFAEGCDHLTIFNMMADLDGGFGGLACSLLENIKDDFNNTPIILWGITESKRRSINFQNTLESQVSQLNIPLVYKYAMELNNLFIPIDTSSFGQQSNYCASLLAAAIEASSYIPAYKVKQTALNRSLNSREYYYLSSGCGSYPMASLEAYIHGVTDAKPSHDGDHPQPSHQTIHQNLLELLSNSVAFEKQYFNMKSMAWNSGIINPFMSSFSSTANGYWTAGNSSTPKKIFSNVISLHGDHFPPDLMKLFMERSSSNSHSSSSPIHYAVSFCQHNPNNLSEYYRDIQHGDSSSNTAFKIQSPLEAIGSLSTHSNMKPHLLKVHGEWESRRPAMRAQLEKTGIDQEECEEISEQLQNLANRYDK